MTSIVYLACPDSPYRKRIETLLAQCALPVITDQDTDAQAPTTIIEQTVKKASHIVYVLTAETAQEAAAPSGTTARLLAAARVYAKPILVTRLEAVTPPPALRYYTAIDALDSDDAALLTALCAWLDQSPGDDRVPLTIHVIPRDPVLRYVAQLYDAVLRYLQTTVTQPIPAAGEPLTEQIMAGMENAHPGHALLVGPPGAGKTIMLMTLARDAAARYLVDDGAPLPILARIDTWEAFGIENTPRETLPLLEWLNRLHPELSTDTLEALFNANKITLYLDGLELLEGTYQDASSGQNYEPRVRFMAALAQFPPENRVLVTCHPDDHRAISRKIVLGPAILMPPLNDDQIETYLADQPILRQALDTVTGLRDTLRLPLYLTLYQAAFAGADVVPADPLQDMIPQLIQRRYAALPQALRTYELPKLRAVLGAAAVADAYAPHRDNRLTWHDFQRAQHGEPDDLIAQATAMGLLVQTPSGELWFAHLELRNYFAFAYLIAALADDNVISRHRAATILAEIGPETIPALLAALDDAPRDLRWRIIDVIGHASKKYNDSLAVPKLVALLEDPSEYVRHRAAHALGTIGTDAVEALLECLQHPNPNVRRYAADTLGWIGDSRALPPLLETLTDDEPIVRRYTVDSLGWIGDSRAVSALIHALTDSDATVRQGAAEALGKVAWSLGDPRAVEPLIDALSDPETTVRRHAADALRKIAPLIVTTRTIPPLIAALKSSDAYIRRYAAAALGPIAARLGDTRPVKPLVQMLRDPSRPVRRRAVEALGHAAALNGDPEAVSALTLLLTDEEKPQFSTRRMCDLAATALEQIATHEALQAVNDWRAINVIDTPKPTT